MAHAVYKRGSFAKNSTHPDRIGGYWEAKDARTPGWSITADTAHEALAFWYEAWRDVKLNGW